MDVKPFTAMADIVANLCDITFMGERFELQMVCDLVAERTQHQIRTFGTDLVGDETNESNALVFFLQMLLD